MARKNQIRERDRRDDSWPRRGAELVGAGPAALDEARARESRHDDTHEDAEGLSMNGET